MEPEDFIKIEENFNTPIPIVPRPCWGAEFIIKESQSEQNLLSIIGIFARAKGKQPKKNISRLPNQ